ncbi:hypothetical protein CORC01_14239 [Colletotrichum orchidophilum]|uniref:Protein kinase domain-containing protein n=1 Tax=Colletotrichum orchidophilum TaxID=1209926 RepID=A0A1G4AN56_9PEZI|nr:uncharacterized protein CORC01_14239 [Colletotrichum orchidophilum]OHE90473.1 hypothetical protein CORC01_14239 [Colletotrichum orchidophilum]
MPSHQPPSRPSLDVTQVTALPAVYVGTHPIDRYKWVRDVADGWIGMFFRRLESPSRPQFVTVQEAPDLTITQFEALAKPLHPNMVQLFGLFLSDRMYRTYELVGLNVFELDLTCEREIAAVLSQLLSSVEYLQSLSERLGIRSIRVSTSGVIKIVPDFATISMPGVVLGKALVLSHETVAAFLQQVVVRLGTGITQWSNEALEFLEILKAGLQPSSTIRGAECLETSRPAFLQMWDIGKQVPRNRGCK